MSVPVVASPDPQHPDTTPVRHLQLPLTKPASPAAPASNHTRIRPEPCTAAAPTTKLFFMYITM